MGGHHSNPGTASMLIKSFVQPFCLRNFIILIFTTTTSLDLKINRPKDYLSISIYRKPTTTYTSIPFNSNHLVQHKLAPYRSYSNRLHTLPLTYADKNKEINTIKQITENNGFPNQTTDRLNEKILRKISMQQTTHAVLTKKKKRSHSHVAAQ